MNTEHLYSHDYVIEYSICFILTKRCVNPQLPPAGMNETPLKASNTWQYAQTSV